MVIFGDRLKSLRNRKGLSQSEFAKQIGVSKSSVNMYERGDREPNFETLEAIADYFNVDLDYLMGKSEIENRARFVLGVTNAAPILTDDESDLLRKYRRLDDAAKGRIRHMVDYEYNSIPGSASEGSPRQA